MTVKCCYCGQDFERGATSKKACSPKCSLEARRAKSREHARKKYVPAQPLADRECAECGLVFIPRTRRNIYCTRACAQRAGDRAKTERYRSVGRECRHCGAEGLPFKPGHPVCDDCRIDPRADAPARERKRRLRWYGLTEDQYEAILIRQGGVCAICKTPDSGPKDWAIDHCHETGAVRGLLCSACNMGIGHLKDSVAVLLAAADYLSLSSTAVTVNG